MKKILTILLTLTSALILISCTKKDEGKHYRPLEITGIEVKEVKPQEIDEIYDVSGTVRPRTSTTISSRIMGEVTGVYAIEGERVRQGQLLLTIDDRDYSERLAQAEEAYQEALKALESARQNKRLADITYERYKKLYDEKALTQQELDQIETQKEIATLELQRIEAMVRRAKAGLEEARLIYGYTKVVSPINGIVTEKKVELGNMVMPGTPLFTLEDSENYRLEVYLDERFTGKVKKGMKVPVYIEARAEALEGRVSEIIPAVDPLTRSFLVKIDLSRKDLKSGLYGRARFLTGKKTGILVPENAIVKRGQLTGVYVVDSSGVISYRIVRTGPSYPEKRMVEVLSGLNPGERIITVGVDRAIEGGIYKKS
ncbi:MAG: efflux RND transporter periplasmic adaptor subunit [Thermodesulfovibrionales bacterium]|nr:efflux RND transporter periplasmic adaptor subunit [Thermodesulfovibrionales bacterium]